MLCQSPVFPIFHLSCNLFFLWSCFSLYNVYLFFLSPLVLKQSPLIQNPLLLRSPHSGIYKGKRWREPPYPIQSHRMGRVAGQPPAGLVSSVFFFSLGRLMGMGLIGFGFLVERERGITGEKISFFPCLCASRGRKSTMSFKTALFVFFLRKRNEFGE